MSQFFSQEKRQATSAGSCKQHKRECNSSATPTNLNCFTETFHKSSFTGGLKSLSQIPQHPILLCDASQRICSPLKARKCSEGTEIVSHRNSQAWCFYTENFNSLTVTWGYPCLPSTSCTIKAGVKKTNKQNPTNKYILQQIEFSTF